MRGVREYQDEAGRSPFAEWFERLSAVAAAKVTAFLARVAEGNTSNFKTVGHGVFELKTDFGPGYRVYVGRDGETLVILLGGGSKRRQQRDIAAAQDRWRDYKRRKKRNLV